MLLLRGLFGTSALYLFFTTLQNIPLAPAMTIQYLSPIFTSVIAIFVLKERVKAPQWIFYAIAFSGVLLIERFDDRVSIFYATLGIVSALFSGVAYNLVRRLREKEHPLTVVLHFQLFGSIGRSRRTLLRVGNALRQRLDIFIACRNIFADRSDIPYVLAPKRKGCRRSDRKLHGSNIRDSDRFDSIR